MRVPRRVSRLLAERQAYVESSSARLRGVVAKAQDRMLSSLLSEIIPLLAVDGDVIKDTVGNYRLLSRIDRVYDELAVAASRPIVQSIGSVTQGISDRAAAYLQVTLDDVTRSRLESVSELTRRKMDIRVGVDGRSLVRGGFLETVTKNEPMKAQLKQFVAQQVTGQSSLRDFTRGFNEIVTGAGEKMGGMEKQFDQFAYDLYNQYDAAYGLEVANELDLNYFIYQGGLIEESRDFCREHNNRVYSKEEAEEWRNWTPSKAINISKFKQKDIYQIPSYIDFPGYEPLIDRGGYNCRHILGWIPDSMAFQLRPDLK